VLAASAGWGSATFRKTLPIVIALAAEPRGDAATVRPAGRGGTYWLAAAAVAAP
jgi:hypothetical protein